jgi:hypothetical protein
MHTSTAVEEVLHVVVAERYVGIRFKHGIGKRLPTSDTSLIIVP